MVFVEILTLSFTQLLVLPFQPSILHLPFTTHPHTHYPRTLKHRRTSIRVVFLQRTPCLEQAVAVVIVVFVLDAKILHRLSGRHIRHDAIRGRLTRHARGTVGAALRIRVVSCAQAIALAQCRLDLERTSESTCVCVCVCVSVCVCVCVVVCCVCVCVCV